MRIIDLLQTNAQLKVVEIEKKTPHTHTHNEIGKENYSRRQRA